LFLPIFLQVLLLLFLSLLPFLGMLNSVLHSLHRMSGMRRSLVVLLMLFNVMGLRLHVLLGRCVQRRMLLFPLLLVSSSVLFIALGLGIGIILGARKQRQGERFLFLQRLFLGKFLGVPILLPFVTRW